MRIQGLATVLIAAATLLLADARADVVIANPTVELNADQVRDLYLGEMQFAGKLKLVPLDNRERLHDFLERVLQSDERKYTARWTRKTFREGIAAPAVKDSDAEVAAFVRRTPGAVGYVREATPGVKVLQKY
ncbi:MAG: hypothetical protein OEW27_10320 [Aquincola sp.]|nr:hypothetical protein [Aquincola sp.]MDH5330332.1 hypothetical protein [Aquincola sp.]